MEIVIGNDNRCTCSCADKCIKEKIGSSGRCTKEELEELGYKTYNPPNLNTPNIDTLYQKIKFLFTK